MSSKKVLLTVLLVCLTSKMIIAASINESYETENLAEYV
jgi:hypothetical protein